LIFRGNRGIAKDPSTPVGMHEEQLPRELAVIGGGVSLPFIPTGEFKRVASPLLDPVGGGAADGGRHLLGRGARGRGARDRARHDRGNARGAGAAAAVAGAATGVAALAVVVAME